MGGPVCGCGGRREAKAGERGRQAQSCSACSPASLQKRGGGRREGTTWAAPSLCTSGALGHAPCPWGGEDPPGEGAVVHTGHVWRPPPMKKRRNGGRKLPAACWWPMGQGGATGGEEGIPTHLIHAQRRWGGGEKKKRCRSPAQLSYACMER